MPKKGKRETRRTRSGLEVAFPTHSAKRKPITVTITIEGTRTTTLRYASTERDYEGVSQLDPMLFCKVVRGTATGLIQRLTRAVFR